MRIGTEVRDAVAESLKRAPVVGVVRTNSREEAARRAGIFIAAGLELIEVTFTVPDALGLVADLRSESGDTGPPWIGMGTVTDFSRTEQAVEAGASFVVSPNTSSSVAAVARRSDVLLMLGALTPSEIVGAHDLGADIVKVFPLPPVGGAAYLETVRQPLGDIAMLAAGGFGVEEIPDYLAAGAVAFGIGDPLLGESDSESLDRIRRALALARGEV